MLVTRTSPAEASDPTRVRCQACDRIVPVLHLTGVSPGPDLESKVADVACASHRVGWTVKVGRNPWSPYPDAL
jgi:hypothetical protein